MTSPPERDMMLTAMYTKLYAMGFTAPLVWQLEEKVPSSMLYEKLLGLGTYSGLDVPEFSPSRCPYCGSKSKNDERGNCAACGGPR